MVEIEINKFSAIPNTIDIKIDGETHTVASVIVENLNKNPSCLFAAYKVNHPYDNFVNIRITAKDEENPVELFKNTLKNIIGNVDILIKQLAKN